MRAHYTAGAGLEQLVKPDAPLWGAATSERLALIGTPLGLQPTAAIRNAWADKRIGAIDAVDVAAVHDGECLAFRLSWNDPHEDCGIEDPTMFTDAVAILIPAVPNAPLVTMGAAGAPVNMWYWRADEIDRARHVVADGIGTTRAIGGGVVAGQGVWKDGRWTVNICRPLAVDTSEPVVQLRPGASIQFAVAVWEGSHGERAGIKAFSPQYVDLQLDEAG